MNFWSRLHCLHRFWRYRISTERESLRFIRSLHLDGSTVFDLGANKGAYTYWLSKAVGKNGQVLALEPQPELSPFLSAVKKTFHLDNVALFNFAASTDSGTTFMNRKFAGHGGAKITRDGELVIPTITLDSLLNLINGPVSFIKCDVEGHELEALKGAEVILRSYQPILQVEIHHQAALAGTVFHYLESLGYSGWFFIEKHRIPLHQLNKYPYPRSDTHRNYFFSTEFLN